VVAHEGVEGGEHAPASAERLGGVARETADVGSDHGDLVDGGEVQDARDTEAVLLPGAHVVSEPLADVLAETDECRASDEERPAFRATLQHRRPRGNRHKRAPEVVDIVVVRAVVVADVSVHGLVADRSSSILDLIARVDEIAAGQTEVLRGLVR